MTMARSPKPIWGSQHLTLSSLALFLPDLEDPLGTVYNGLGSLSLSPLVRARPGAVLELKDVTIVVSENELDKLYYRLCGSTSAWPHTPGVALEGGEVRITQLDSVDPSLPGGGGAVRWRNVTITCPGYGLHAPYPCAAAPVASTGELQSVAERLLGGVSGGPVFLSLTSDIAAVSEPGDVWNPPDVPAGSRVVLVGDPTRSTTLDMAGQNDAWWAGYVDTVGPTLAPWYQLPVAHLRDLTLVNLPLADAPESPGELMALGMNSFRIASWMAVASLYVAHIPLLTLTRCTLVLPDEELAFLQQALREAVVRGGGGAITVDSDGGKFGDEASDVVVPSGELRFGSGPFAIEITPRGGTGTGTTTGSDASGPIDGRLEVAVLKMLPRVLLLNCTLLSASAYKALPGAVELLRQSRVWPLQSDEEDPARSRGPLAFVIATGMQEALEYGLWMCGSAPGHASTVLIGSRNDHSLGVEVHPGALLSSIVQRQGRTVDAAGGCAVSGLPEGLGTGRTFVDLKGLSGMFTIRRPLSLRNLVLYNLAPGGTNGTGTLPGGLEGPDVPWANSSLPLWLFGFDRSKPVSYDFESGVLVLSSVRHYGWEGIDITITHIMPPDAPADASPLPHPYLFLPYQEFTGADVSPSPSVTERAHNGGAGPGGRADGSARGALTGKLSDCAVDGGSKADALRDNAFEERDTGGTATTLTTETAMENSCGVTFAQTYFSGQLGNLTMGTDPDGCPKSESGLHTNKGRRKSHPVFQCMAETIRALQAQYGEDDLEVVSVLGRGAYGVVYWGTWRGLPVAVKTLVVPAVTAGPEGRARQRAVLEAAISMSMAHPNVVATYSYDIKLLTLPPAEAKPPPPPAPPATQAGGLGSLTICLGAACDTPVSGQPDQGPEPVTSEAAAAAGGDEADAYKLYIVQELCSGGSLKHALIKGVAGAVRAGGVFRALALGLALDVAQGMRHVHSCRIVHGDLKPDNVLLAYHPSRGAGAGDGEGPGDCPASLMDTVDSAGGGGGPLALTAKVLSRGELSPRADVWSFGLMLLELFYGCTLSDMRAVQAVMFSAAQIGAVPLYTWLLRDILESGHRPYAELAASCLSREPRERPDFATICKHLQVLMEDRLAGER
ncbi:hypothetical protein GPECTOR_15g366 [Gonium pectorale]|uniref:Protein kinase domain-containing protein n=1 Tax=Gonium pectorale TaxID=33097 RepID=A0A150GLN6_GONPE|nr:hypothetical protein GPECTOR_15g366 [Gonium pectorale]|eukprot:KXZ50682.1 hypothetical protein GPECTOR_15g366 [Gonium pectorale]